MKLNSPVPHKKARIEIIPLIDIMFFLLASFMLVSLSMIRMKGVKLNLPQAATASAETEKDFYPISIKTDGEILWDKEPAPISLDALTARIRPMWEQNKDVRIYINADTDARHGAVIEVLDHVRQAGVTKVSFAIKPGAKTDAPPIVPAPAAAPAAPTAPVAPPAPNQ